MPERNQRYRFGPFELDLEKHLLWRDGDLLALSPKLAETLAVLVEHEGDLVEKRDLFSRVWPNTAVEENSLSQNISALRKLLGSAEGGQQYIETIPRRGYRFINWSTKTRRSEIAPLCNSVGRVWSRRRATIASLLCLVLLTAAVATYLSASHDRHRLANDLRSSTTAKKIEKPLPTRKSIAVMDLKNLSAQRDTQWLGSALGEMFRIELCADGALREIPGERVARMKSELAIPDEGSFAPDTLKEIRNNLQMDLLVIGSYSVLQNHGVSRIRVDVRVQDALTGETLASDEVTGLEHDLFQLASAASAHLRSKLGLEDLSPQIESSAITSIPKSPLAARFYSEGIAALRHGQILRARNDFAKAIQIEPGHPAPHAGLAHTWTELGYDENARKEARLAFKYSASLPLENRLFIEGAYWSLVHDWEKARLAYATLSEHYPDNIEYVLKLTEVENAAGTSQEALGALNSFKQKTSNQDPRIDFGRAVAYRNLGDYKTALDLWTVARQGADLGGMKHLVGDCFIREGEALLALGNITGAIARLDGAEKIYTQLEDQQALAALLVTRANALRSHISYNERGDTYRRALAIFKQVGNDFGTARALNALAGVQEDSGDLDVALSTYEQALTLRRRIRDLGGQALVLNNIGTVFEVEGKLARSEEYYERALDICTKLHTLDGTALALGNVAEVQAQQGDLDGARKNYERALRLASNSNKLSLAATIQSGLGDVARLRGDLQIAHGLYEHALAQSRQSKDNEGAAITLNRLCEIHATQGDFTSTCCRESLSLSKNTGNLLGVAESQLALARVALSAGALNEAESIARNVARTYQQQQNRDAQLAALTVLVESIPPSASERNDAVQRVREIAEKTENPYLRIDASIAIIASGSNHRSSTELRELGNNEAEARKLGFYELELKARLAIARLQSASGNQDASYTLLANVANDARTRGFYVLAKSAEQARIGR